MTNGTAQPSLKEIIAKAYLDLTEVSRREAALKILITKGAIGQLQVRLFEDELKDIEKVYNGAELGDKMSKAYAKMMQPVLYAINGQNVDPEDGIREGAKFLNEFEKKYTR